MFQQEVGDTALWSAVVSIRFANAFTGKGATSAAQFKAIRNQIANTKISKRWAGRMAQGSVANQILYVEGPVRFELWSNGQTADQFQKHNTRNL